MRKPTLKLLSIVMAFGICNPSAHGFQSSPPEPPDVNAATPPGSTTARTIVSSSNAGRTLWSDSFPASRELNEAEKKLQEMLGDVESAAENGNLDEVSDDLSEAVSNVYKARIQAHEVQLEALEKKVQEMREQIQARRDATSEIVNLQTQLIMRKAEVGEFDELETLQGLMLPRPTAPSRPPLNRFLAPKPPAFPVPGMGNALIENAIEGSLPILLDGYSKVAEDPGLVVFASDRQLRDGQLVIKGVDSNQSATISFDNEEDDLETRLPPGVYTYHYEQDGEVWGEGRFEKDSSTIQVIEIESGEFNPDLVEHRKVDVTFDTGETTLDGTLWVKGLDLSYNAREFEGKLDGQLNFSFLPGEYIFLLFGSNGNLVARTFEVEPGKELTINLFDSEETSDESFDK